MCGFTDVVNLDGKYQCSKCGKVMPPDWAHHVEFSGKKVPTYRKATRDEKILNPGVYEVKERPNFGKSQEPAQKTKEREQDDD